MCTKFSQQLLSDGGRAEKRSSESKLTKQGSELKGMCSVSEPEFVHWIHNFLQLSQQDSGRNSMQKCKKKKTRFKVPGDLKGHDLHLQHSIQRQFPPRKMSCTTSRKVNLFMSQTVPNYSPPGSRHEASSNSSQQPSAEGHWTDQQRGSVTWATRAAKAVVELQQLCWRALDTTISKGSAEPPCSLDNPSRSALLLLECCSENSGSKVWPLWHRKTLGELLLETLTVCSGFFLHCTLHHVWGGISELQIHVSPAGKGKKNGRKAHFCKYIKWHYRNWEYCSLCFFCSSFK